jgi:hypothetical protein
MPMLQVSASIATKGTMTRDVTLAVPVTAEQASQYVPTMSPGGSPDFAYWNDIEELVCTALGRKLFPDEGPPVTNADDMRRLGVWFLKVILQDEQGGTNQLTLINDQGKAPG